MNRVLLVLNAGSSSLKFQVFDLEAGDARVRLRGKVENVGGEPRFAVKAASGETVAQEPMAARDAADQASLLRFVMRWIERALPGVDLAAAGHRVVHGGARHSAPVRLTPDVLDELQALEPLAPLHQPFSLTPIRALLASHPQLPQVACFDTAFHRSQPMVAQLYALPMRYYDEGVRRYGFHGLSYEYVAQELCRVAPDAAEQRVVVAHLGNGVSLCAMRAGRSVATTMGFTPLDGLPMGTRCGSLDPGVVIHLAREYRMTTEAIERLLYRESGLLGLSGVASDMRELLASNASGARLAVDYFVYRLARELGSLAAALGGLDMLVFTAGIGENSAEIRTRVCEQAGWLGIELDAQANAARGPCISRPGARVSAWIIPTNEELMIARHTCALLGRQ